jgi:O-antigen ligase
LSNSSLDGRSVSGLGSMSNPITRDPLRRTAMIVLALILIVTGSYVRTRSLDEGNSLDWLVLVQLALTMCGGCLGLLLMRRDSRLGFGARALVVYLLALLVTSFFSLYFTTVFGYWVLLTGTAALCMGLVGSAPTEDSLRAVEKLVLATISFMLLKDTLVDALVFAPQIDRMEELGIEMYRFGMGSTSSNSMGLLAALAFWMSFSAAPERSRPALWKVFWRGLFATVVILTRTRIALSALVIGAVVRWWFVHWHSRNERSNAVLIATPCITASLVLVLAIGWLWRFPLIADTVHFVNRGETAETIMSVTGRTDIWTYAMTRSFESPLAIAFGHGYSASKLVLNQDNRLAGFFAYHSHNTFLEVLLSTGLMGFLPFLVLIVYGTTWLVRFSEVCRSFSLGFTLRAATVMSAIVSSTMTESELAVKVGPVVILFVFYLLCLDRRLAFSRLPAPGVGYARRG